MSKKSPKLAVIDDHELLRVGVCETLSPKYRIVLSTSSLSDLLTFKQKLDLIILDLNLDNLPGYAVLDKVLENIPDAKMVVYSMRDSIESIDACYKAHAMAFVSKGQDTAHLVNAVETVLSGEIYFDPDILPKLSAYQYQSDNSNPKTILRPKEFEVFLLRARGRSAAEIAEELEIDPRNVYNYISSIQKKLGITKHKFADLAKRYGFLGDDEAK